MFGHFEFYNLKYGLKSIFLSFTFFCELLHPIFLRYISPILYIGEKIGEYIGSDLNLYPSMTKQRIIYFWKYVVLDYIFFL